MACTVAWETAGGDPFVPGPEDIAEFERSFSDFTGIKDLSSRASETIEERDMAARSFLAMESAKEGIN